MDEVGLTNDYVEAFLSRTSPSFYGINKLDKILHDTQRFSVVHNISGHFVGMIGLANRIIYFDPLGLNISNREMQDFLKADTRKKIENSTTYQHPLSAYCGFFVILRILCEDYNPTGLKHFNFSKLEKNDAICVQNIINIVRS